MTPREQLNEHLKANYSRLKNIAHRFYNGKDSPDDILQETLCYVLELDDENIERILPFIDKYIVQIIKLSFISNSSAYQQKYNKLKMQDCDDINYYVNKLVDEDYDHSIDKLNEMVEEILLEDCTWYQAEVFKTKILTGKSFNVIGKECNIPASSLWESYNEALEIIKKNLK